MNLTKIRNQINKYYTEEDITEAIELHEDFFLEEIEHQGLIAYSNEERDQDGNILSFYIGLEDESGRAVTEYEEDYPEK